MYADACVSLYLPVNLYDANPVANFVSVVASRSCPQVSQSLLLLPLRRPPLRRLTHRICRSMPKMNHITPTTRQGIVRLTAVVIVPMLPGLHGVELAGPLVL